MCRVSSLLFKHELIYSISKLTLLGELKYFSGIFYFLVEVSYFLEASWIMGKTPIGNVFKYSDNPSVCNDALVHGNETVHWLRATIHSSL